MPERTATTYFLFRGVNIYLYLAHFLFIYIFFLTYLDPVYNPIHSGPLIIYSLIGNFGPTDRVAFCTATSSIPSLHLVHTQLILNSRQSNLSSKNYITA
jgi:hypothetical protein